ncbi:MAG: HAMP domain-containing sensor histidine kinase [Bacilli bacterium]|nr:HAMP domain-containing sensor histidine kinase [Bacilli bacterium]
MIERFRKKFIAYATLSIGLLLLLILGAINITNFTMVATDADSLTQALADAGGNFKEPVKPEGEPGEGGTPMRPDGPEMRMSARYFTVKIDSDGTASMVAFHMTNFTVDINEALSWGASLKSQSKGWTRTYYRFRSYNYEGATYVSVIDYNRELSPSYRVLWGSIIGSAAGILISFFLLIPVSKILVKPLVVSTRKQQRFISDASHELKTPITIISANNEIMEAVHGESEQTTAISKQVSRLTAMVKNLNALARMEEQETQVMGEVDISAIASDVVTSFHDAFEAKGINFSAELPPNLKIKGDGNALSKLISIFLDNALKYSLTTAEFHLYCNEGRTMIKVINDAEGLEEGSLDQVFDRFYRSDIARASGIEGSGIGLSIAKEIVANHRGRIMAKCVEGKFIIKAEL